jgi:hypothetical protein
MNLVAQPIAEKILREYRENKDNIEDRENFFKQSIFEESEAYTKNVILSDIIMYIYFSFKDIMKKKDTLDAFEDFQEISYKLFRDILYSTLEEMIEKKTEGE